MVFVVNGGYTVTSPLIIGNNTHLQLGVGVTLMRSFAGLPTIANANYLNGGTNANIRVSGGLLTTGLQGVFTGKHLNFRNVTGLWVTGMRFTSVQGDWNTAFIDCNDVVVSQIVMRSGTASFTDGLHFAGCRRVTVSDSIIECGDDALSLTNESAVANLNPLEDFVATNLYLYSHRANPVRIAIIKQQGSSWTPTPIRRVRLSNIVAKAGDATGGGGSLLIRGLSPDLNPALDLISDIEMDGFTFDGIQTGSPLDLDYCRRIRISRFVAITPGARAEIDGSTDVELNDCVIDSPRTDAAQCLLVAASPIPSLPTAPCANIRVIGGQYRNATHNAIVLGSTGATGQPVNGFEISGALIQGWAGNPNPPNPLGPTLSGLFLVNASGGIVRGNNIMGCTVWAIRETTPSTNNTYIANRLKNNAVLAQGLSIFGATSDGIRNVPDIGKQASDTGGFRQTIDGWQFVDIDANQGLTEMTRIAGRFRAARSGSVTGITVATSKLPPGPVTGSITAWVYKNVNAFGDLGITTGLSATITPTDNGKQSKTQNQDANPASIFAPGDELYIVVQASGWTPGGTDVFAGLEIED